MQRDPNHISIKDKTFSPANPYDIAQRKTLVRNYTTDSFGPDCPEAHILHAAWPTVIVSTRPFGR
jgi:hypothetical protein